MLRAALRKIGASTREFLQDTGSLSRLAGVTLGRFVLGPFTREGVRWRLTVAQALEAGNRSIPLVFLICFLVGMIVALQSAYQLAEMGAMDLVASLVAVSMTRELAPLLTAIMVTGRFGSSIAAALGTMKVSQEIDALQVMGIDPISFLVVPRIVGLLIALPCLTVFADAVGILGGLVVGVSVLEVGYGGYLADSFDAMVLQDILAGIVKSVVFAWIIGLVGCHQGLQTRGGAEQVGRATTVAVVRSIVLIIGADLFVTALFYARG